MATPLRPPKPASIRQSLPAATRTPPLENSKTPVPGSGIDEKYFEGRSLAELATMLDHPQLLNDVYLTEDPIASQYAQVLEDMENKQDKLRDHVEQLRIQAIEKKLEAENSLINTKELENEWEAIERSMYTALKPYASESLYTRLQAAASDSERLSESLVSSFLEPGAPSTNDDIQDFIKEYRETRKLHHLRTERLARWKEGRVGDLR